MFFLDHFSVERIGGFERSGTPGAGTFGRAALDGAGVLLYRAGGFGASDVTGA